MNPPICSMSQDDPFKAGGAELAAGYLKDVLNVRLRFGEPQRIRHGSGLTRYWFAPGQRFGVIWWARLSPRRQVAGFAVAEALTAGQAGYRVPCIGGIVQVHAYLNCRCAGKDRGVVGRADKLIRRIQEADIDPCRVPPAYYRLAGQAIRAGHDPRRIDRAQLLRFLEEQAHEN